MKQRIFSISDLHLSINNPKPMDIFGENWEGYLSKIEADWNKKVSENDIVLIAGDISWAMKLEDAAADLKYISKLKGSKILIKGNHDYWWSSISKIRNILPDKMYALQNDAVKIGKYVFCGTRGWSLPEKKDFNEEDKKILIREQNRLELALMQATKLKDKKSKIICMMHYPPFNSKIEDSVFTKLMEKYKVKSVVYGHLHGKSKSSLFVKKNKIKYYLTSCDKLENKLIKIR